MTVRISRDVYDKLVDIAIARDCTLYEAWDFYFKSMEKTNVKEKVVYKDKVVYKEPRSIEPADILSEMHGKAPTGRRRMIAWLYDHGYAIVKKGDGG